MARPDLLGHARAAENLAPLEDADAQTGLGEIGGGREPVVAAADDDRVVAAAAQRRVAPLHLATAIRSLASSSTAPRIRTISSNSSGPATSGGRDLHDRVAAIIRAEDQAVPEELR